MKLRYVCASLLVSVLCPRCAVLKDAGGQPHMAAEDLQPRRVLWCPTERGPQAWPYPCSPHSLCKPVPGCFRQQPGPKPCLTNKGHNAQQEQRGDHGDDSPQLPQETWKQNGLQNEKKSVLICNIPVAKLVVPKAAPEAPDRGGVSWKQVREQRHAPHSTLPSSPPAWDAATSFREW